MNDDDVNDTFWRFMREAESLSPLERDALVPEYEMVPETPPLSISEALAPRYTPKEAAARYPKGLESVTLKGGQKIKAHARGSCSLYWCPIHHISNHHMNQWIQLWLSEEQRMYRVCPDHGCAHPDPDDLVSGNPQDHRCHCACDCCARPFDINSEI